MGVEITDHKRCVPLGRAGCTACAHGTIAHLVVSSSSLAFRMPLSALGSASRTVRAHGTMRMGCLGVPGFVYAPGVLATSAAAPAPSGWGDKDRGTSGDGNAMQTAHTQQGPSKPESAGECPPHQPNPDDRPDACWYTGWHRHWLYCIRPAWHFSQRGLGP